MEFHELLENEKFKAAIGTEKLALYSGECGSSLMWEDFEHESAPALILEAEHKMCICIQKWHGFYIWSDAETSTYGAAESLEDLIGEYPFEFESWRASNLVLASHFEATDISLQELKAFALKLISDGDQVEINDEEYQKVAGDLIEYSEALEKGEDVVLEILISAGDEDGCLDIHKWGSHYISQYYATGEDICTDSLEEHIKKFLAVGDSLEWRPEYTELKSTNLRLDELKALGLIFLSVESSTAEDGLCTLPQTGQQFSSQITINGKTYERHNGELVEVSS
jgi:hypothetical protein